MGPGADDGKGMRMDFNKIVEVISERKGVVAAAALGIAALGGLAWALSTGPLTSVDAGSGSTGSTGPGAPSAMGSAITADPGAEETAGEPVVQGDSAVEGAAVEDGRSSAGGEGEGDGTADGKPAQNQQAPKPSHAHSWSAVYRTESVYGEQWVSKWEDVFIKRQERWICGCGQTFSDWSSCTSHRAAMAEAGTPCGRVIDDSYDIWEKRDNGSYQNVQTGTKQVLDHYECSCGATK